ncbi:hypothetical protein ABPG77_000270 [Micractinium sp. CCAP 211/92]
MQQGKLFLANAAAADWLASAAAAGGSGKADILHQSFRQAAAWRAGRRGGRCTRSGCCRPSASTCTGLPATAWELGQERRLLQRGQQLHHSGAAAPAGHNTLGLAYMQVAHRLGLPMVGVNIPGHFMISPADPELEFLVDAFQGGEVCFSQDAEETLSRIYRQPIRLDAAFLTPGQVYQGGLQVGS